MVRAENYFILSVSWRTVVGNGQGIDFLCQDLQVGIQVLATAKKDTKSSDFFCLFFFFPLEEPAVCGEFGTHRLNST